VWQWQRFPCTHGRGAAVEEEEEASVEVVVEKTGSSGVHGGGDQWSMERRSRERWGLREFWDESETTRGRLLFMVNHC
jgi:hypothetical protein